MKVKISAWRLIWRFLILVLIIYTLGFPLLITFFFDVDWLNFAFTPKPFGADQIVVIVILVVLALISFIPALFTSYYKIEDKYFIERKYWKEYHYDYKNIEFIDINTSKAKNMVIFYAKTCGTKYLLGDKNGVLLETLIKKCPETMSVQEFKMKHPEERY